MIETLTPLLATLAAVQIAGLALAWVLRSDGLRGLGHPWVALAVWPVLVPTLLAGDRLTRAGFWVERGVFDLLLWPDDTLPGYWRLDTVRWLPFLHLGEWDRPDAYTRWVAFGRRGSATAGFSIGRTRIHAARPVTTDTFDTAPDGWNLCPA